MRLLVVAILAVTPVVADAQPASRWAGGVPPLPALGLPLPSIGIPHRPTGLPHPEGADAPGPVAGRDAKPGRHRRRHVQQAFSFVYYPFFFVPPPSVASAVTDTGAQISSGSERVGRLTFAVTPATAQLYMDGEYVGTPGDYPDGIELAAGSHVLDVRAPGFASAATSVRVAAGRAITYHASLAPLFDSGTPPAPSPPSTQPDAAKPVPPTRFYAIPGCYLGNVAPEAAHLPTGCDPAHAVVFQP